MATKAQPGPYDCYAKAADDEPIFTLRAKDPIAPYLVEIWVASRKGRWDECVAILGRAVADAAVQARVSSDNYDKLQEADAVADSMRAWFKLNTSRRRSARRRSIDTGDFTVNEDGSFESLTEPNNEE